MSRHHRNDYVWSDDDDDASLPDDMSAGSADSDHEDEIEVPGSPASSTTEIDEIPSDNEDDPKLDESVAGYQWSKSSRTTTEIPFAKKSGINDEAFAECTWPVHFFLKFIDVDII